MGKQDGSITNARGQKLHTVAWVPAAPKAVLMWHHGVGEYADRMAEGEASDPAARPLCGAAALYVLYIIRWYTLWAWGMPPR